MNRLALACLAGALAFSACDSADPEVAPVALDVQTATDVAADPTSGRDPNTGAAISNNLFTLYDLDAGQVVLSSSETDRAVRRRDSSSTVWDVGFKGTTIIVNGGVSGPGRGTAQILAQPFAEVTEAPAAGYVADGANTGCPAVQTPAGPAPGSALAICAGSDAGWYNYNASQNLISPLPGRTIVMTTGEGDYAKLRILSYYQGNPNPPSASAPSRYFTFEYIVQPDGSRGFASTVPGV